MLKAAEISSTPKPLSQLDFPLTITTPSIEGNTFNYTPVVSQCILIAADQNSTALLLANRPDQTWGQDNCILCVSVKKKAKTSKPHPLLPSLQNQGEKNLLEYADTLQGSPTLEQKAEPSAYVQVKILNSFMKDEMKPLKRKIL